MLQRTWRLLALAVLLLGGTQVSASEVTFSPRTGAMAIIEDGRSVPVLIAADEHESVLRAAGDLRADLGRVAGSEPVLLHSASAAPTVILVGTLGESALVDRLVREGKLDPSGLAGEWEA